MSRALRCRNPGALAGATGAEMTSGCNRKAREQYTTDSRQSTACELIELAHAVRRIHDPMRSNPAAIFEAKDEIAGRLISIARQMGAANG